MFIKIAEKRVFNKIYLKKIIKSKLELRNFDIAYYRIKRSFQSRNKHDD